jgi:hypothetical protein
MLANSDIKAEIAANPGLKEDKDRLKKVKGQRLNAARARVGAKKEKIRFTDREWEAIQSGAIRKTTLEKIISNADKDEVKQRSTPKANLILTSSKISKKGMKVGNRPSARYFDKDQGWQTNNPSESIRLYDQGNRKRELKDRQTRSAQGTEGSRLGGSRKPLTYKSKKARLQSWRRKRGIR